MPNRPAEREQHHVGGRHAAQERKAGVPGDREEDRPLAPVAIGERAGADAADHAEEQRDRPSTPASALLTEKLCWMSTRTKVRMVKSKASSIQAAKVVRKAFHCCRETSLYQGIAGDFSREPRVGRQANVFRCYTV